MQATFVVSANIDAVGYQQGRLYIRFKSGGAYAYDKAPFSAYDGIVKAESPGQFFHRFIKPNYPHIKLEADPFKH